MTRLYAAYEAEPGLRDIDTEAFEAADPGCPPEAGAVPDDDDDDRPRDATFGRLGDQPTLVFHRRYESFLRGSLPFVKLDCGYQELLVVSGAEGADPALYDDDDLIALRDDPAHHARFTALAARAWWRRA